MAGSEIFVISDWELFVGSILNLLGHSLDLVLVNDDLLRLKERSFSESEVGVSDESSEEPDEGLLELVVGLGGDIVVLEVLLSVESDLLGLDLSVLDIDLVANEHNGDVLADSDEILVPLGDVLVGDSGADIEHDDSAVATDAKK